MGGFLFKLILIGFVIFRENHVTESGALTHSITYGVPTLALDLPAFKEMAEKWGCVSLFKTGDLTDFLRQASDLFLNKEKQTKLKQTCSQLEDYAG